MNDEGKNPELQKLFVAAEQELDGQAFVASVNADIEAARRRSFAARTIVGLVALLFVASATTWAESSAVAFSAIVTTQLIPVQDAGAFDFLMPLNSIGAALAFSLLSARAVFTRLT